MARRSRSLKEQIEDRSNKVETAEDNIVEFISSGSIMTNLAASGKGKDGGWGRGRVINLVGDGSSGKTLTALEALAWAFYNLRKRESSIFPKIKKLIIVYNNSEGVMDFPIVEMFGQEFVDAVEWTFLDTCEAFGRDLLGRIEKLKEGECLLYVQDSIDSTISEAAKKRIDESIKKDKTEEASYGTEKAKYFSQSFFNRLCGMQQGKDATVFLISQVRENLNAGMFGKKFYRTGGKSLDFYTHQVAWLYKKDSLKKTFRGNERVYGVNTLYKFERNKVAKPYREAESIVRFDYGVDDVQSMLNFLYGPKDKEVDWYGESMKISELRLHIDENEREYNRLVHLVEKEWREIENAMKVDLKPKYGGR